MKKIFIFILSLSLTIPIYAVELNEPEFEKIIEQENLDFMSGSDLDEFISIEVDPNKLKNEIVKENKDISDFGDEINGEVTSNELLVGSNAENEVEYWNQYSCHFIDNQLNDVEKNLWDNLDLTFYQYLLTNEDISNNVYVESKFTNSNDLINSCYMYRYSRPQFYFLRPRMTYYSYYDQGVKYYAVSLKSYDDLSSGKVRKEKTPEIKKILNEWVGIAKSGSNDYNKSMIIHNLITNKVEYDYPVIADSYDWGVDSHHSQSMYSTLCTDKTVCAGYAITFNAVANAVGILGSSITGSGHAWSTVNIENDWYFIDVCWDDGGRNYEYFLVSSSYCVKRDTSHIRYDYWNRFIPQCTTMYRTLTPGIGKYYGVTDFNLDSPTIDYDLAISPETSTSFNIPYNLIIYLNTNYLNKKIPNIKRTGYIFNNWYLNGEIAKKYPKEKISSLVYRASYTPITYNIQFAKNGGSNKTNKKIQGTMTKMSKLEYDTSYTLPKNNFVREGYIFLGWSTNKKDKSPMFLDQGSIKNLSSKLGENIKLFAIWKKK